MYNAYNIYSVEGDEHAFQKMNRCEKKIVYHYFLSKDFRNIMNEFREYYKLVPLKHYFSFVLSFLWMILLYAFSFLRMILSKIGNIFRRMVH